MFPKTRRAVSCDIVSKPGASNSKRLSPHQLSFLLALCTLFPILSKRSSGPGLLADSDTAVTLIKIKERANPWSWFGGDWPLENHFYRPISTLFYELDNALHGSNPAGFGLTNALLCFACTMALYWFVSEWRRSTSLAVLSAWLFTLWQIGGFGFESLALIVLPILALAGIIARPKNWGPIAGAFLLTYYAAVELTGVAGVFGGRNISGDTLGWVPGRTATSMTLFCLLALAAYFRFERLGAEREVTDVVTATDLPATRTSEAKRDPVSKPGWLIAAFGFYLLALGAYEQAVMLPFVLIPLGWLWKSEGYRLRWITQLGFWAGLVLYAVMRSQLLPVKPSGYQLQQFRTGPGVYQVLVSYLIPGLNALPPLQTSLSFGLDNLLNSQPWMLVLAFACNGSLFVIAFLMSRAKKAGTATVLQKATAPLFAVFAASVLASVLAFAPIAFLHSFGHYHYWPMALRAIGVIVLMQYAIRYAISAVSHRPIQAPQRSHPAPGSLPHL